jgi:pyruvate dehydrogenase (quinone)
VVGDVKATLTALLPVLEQKRDRTHLEQARGHYAKTRKALDDLAAPGKG